MTKFPSRMFRWAAIYGVIVLAPLYLLPLPIKAAEIQLGFVSLALTFQAIFWVIGSDPVRFRPLMPIAVVEKLVFALPALALYFVWGRTIAAVAVFAVIDLLLGLGFFLAWRKTPLTRA